MKLSTKVRYGIRAMIELAKTPDGTVIPLKEIAMKQKISHKYLEPIISNLKVASLVESVLGKGGGYRLARPADRISLWDIYTTLDISSQLIECLSQSPGARNVCPKLEECAAREAWLELSEVIDSFLKSTNIKDLARRETYLKSRHISST